MNWKPTKLSEVLTERGERIKFENANQLGLQRIKKIDFSGNIHLDAETDTKTDMIRVKSGDLVVSGINAAKGAIAVHAEDDDVLATIHYSTYEFNSDRISVDFLKWFFKSSEFSDLLREQIPGGIKTELKSKHILPLQVKLPDLAEQIMVAERLNRFRLEQLKLEYEITHQKSLLANLKQAILQEAIQGKLTSDWRIENTDVEPARQFLNRIQNEKVSLIAAKKLRPGKPLPKITPAKIPFEIPKGWVWARIQDILDPTRDISYGVIKLGVEPKNGGVFVLRCSDVKPGFIDFENVRAVTSEIENEYLRTRLKGGEILINIRGTLGGVAIVPNEIRGHNIAREVAMIPFHESLNKTFCMYALLSPFFWATIQSNLRGAIYKGINLGALRDFMIPLPPLVEQTEIVERLEVLMGTYSGLEAEIETNLKHVNNLIKALLKEAFSPASS